MDQPIFSPESFSGRARIFALPHVTLFPHVLLPLHIFEPRYRELLEDAMAGDRLLAMAVLSPGWEADYEGRPPIANTACLGYVTSHVRLDDGTYNLLLQGLRRVRLGRELPPDRLFREVEAELLEDAYPDDGALERPKLRRQLAAAFRDLLRPGAAQASAGGAQANAEQTRLIAELLEGQMPMGALTDVMAHALDLPQAAKLELLGEIDVDARARRLITALESRAGQPPQEPFPPKFSTN